MDPVGKVADGELRSCQIVTVAQAWAVGDRGLILATNDAGKTWAVQHQRSEAIHYSVCFANEKKGWVFGGTIEPYSHRSRGTVLTTVDGGRNWQQLPCKLPRLTGSQWLGNDHLLAWGDWSNLYQSALFESMDGGQTWNARPTPCSHVQSASIGLKGELVLLDRSGKIHQTHDGLVFETVHLPVTSFEPLRFCKQINGIWWLGGDAGQLYRSMDALQWKRVALPGNAEDQALFSLKDMAGFGNRVWVVGQPGNVVWSSEDLGDHWVVRSTGGTTTNHSISALTGDVLLTCGPLATIRTSRNGGKAWWAQHQSGMRNALFNVASTSSSIAWDLLAHVTLDSNRHASVFVLHDQCFEERTAGRPELASRVEIAGKTIGLSQADVQSNMPVGNLYCGVRPSDLEYYGSQATSMDSLSENSLIVRRVALEIRSVQPDVLVSNCDETGNALEVKSAQAVAIAARLAGQRDFRIFSEASGIAEESWSPKRILVRGTRNGLSFPNSMLLKSNLFLGSSIASIRPLMEYPGSVSLPDQRFSYRILGSRTAALRDPFEGVFLDPSTQMIERTKIAIRTPSLMATNKILDWKQVLESEHANPLTQDRVWESNLKALAKEVSPETASPILMDIAVQSRRAGDWQRWYSALELLIERDRASPMGEAAFWELMMHTGSVEVRRVIESQIKRVEERYSHEQNSMVAAAQQASPFAKSPREATDVQQVSFSSAVRRIPIATNRDLSEFSRVFSRWPDSFASRRSEPRWGWLIASRYRTMQKLQDRPVGAINLNRNPSDFWPILSNQVPSWTRVAEVERSLLGFEKMLGSSQKGSRPAATILVADRRAPSGESNGINSQPIRKTTEPNVAPMPLQSAAKPVSRLAWVDKPPFLDGKDDEIFWSRATELELRDPWTPTRDSRTTLRFARDNDYLYVFSRSPFNKSTNASTIPLRKEKRRDSVTHESDHFKLRLDIDRDYASWFEFSWSSSGETSEACNDMAFWNPTWHIAMSNDNASWAAEIAIPFEEILESTETSPFQWSNEVWAMNVVHCIPSAATLSIAPSISDRMASDDWIYFDLKSTSTDSVETPSPSNPK